MSDNLKIYIQVEIYDKASLAYDGKGEIIAESLKKVINDRLRGFDYPEDSFFVYGGCVN